jgi:hypothetical protein
MTRKLRVQALEDRSVPSFGFVSAFSFGGPGIEHGFGLALDGASSTYVCGYYNGTVDFDPDHTNPASNHVLTASGASGDNYAAKYLSDGTFQWATDLGTVTGACESVTVQGTNIYVGYTNGYGGDTFVSKLDAGTGAVAWTTDLASGAIGTPGVAASPSGGVFVTAVNAAGQAFVSRLDATGAVTWTRTSSGGSARGVGLAVDASGNPIASGNYTGTVTLGSKTLTSWSSTQDVFVWKLNSSGGSVWAGSVGSNGSDTFGGITVDGSGNAIVTGEWGSGGSNPSQNNNFNPNAGSAVKLTNNGGNDVFIVKLGPGTNGSMNLSWAKDIGGSGNELEQGLALDTAGNVYTTGHFTGTVNFNPNKGQAHYLSGGGIFVSKLDASGNYVAAAGMAGSADGNGLGTGRGIAVDTAGNVYMTGVFFGTADFDPTAGIYNLTSNGGNSDAFVLKLTQSGTSAFAGGGTGSGDLGNPTANPDSDSTPVPPISRSARVPPDNRDLSLADFEAIVLHGASVTGESNHSDSLAVERCEKLTVADDELILIG